jgi:hypothetical protein
MGHFHGKGRYSYASGAYYEGGFHEHQRHGHGEMHFHDGIKYIGPFVDDCMHGKGKLIYPDGTEAPVEFNMDQLVEEK